MAILLGVNIDHVATLRQARLTNYPSPVEAALLVQKHGADSITAHLREDRRHIQDSDIIALKQNLSIRLNLEMALTEEMFNFALKVKPSNICIVPEKRHELTTEGGLDLLNVESDFAEKIKRLQDKEIDVSVFIDADLDQIQVALDLGIHTIELHTGKYANAVTTETKLKELDFLYQGASFAIKHGIKVNAGHGLHYQNTGELVKKIPQLNELNIGHSIIANAVFCGLPAAVKQMRTIINS